jgi:chromate reductase, NAD(P)H dehydrogenase (quinone)
MKILAIAGSIRSGSHNARLLRSVAVWLPDGVTIEQWDRIGELPYFNEDLEADPGREVTELRDAVRGADALLIATPEYNHSIPGVLKNALDWLSRPTRAGALERKPAAVIGASTSMFGAVWAQAETRKVLAAAGAEVIDLELPVPYAHDAISEDDVLAEGVGEILVPILVTLHEAAVAKDAA